MCGSPKSRILEGMAGTHRVFLSFLLALGLAAACNLNPQPEVPGGSAGTGGFGAVDAGAGVGGAGATGGGGMGGTNTSGGMGGAAGSGAVAGVVGCPTPCDTGKACNAETGNCVDDPCEPNSCATDQGCKPNADFTAAECFESCFGVVCDPGQTCVDGTCKTTGCATACTTGEVCAPTADGGFACRPDLCAKDGGAGTTCLPGATCNPVTGECDEDPCNAVKCPTAQSCNVGQCAASSDGGALDAGPEAGDASSD